MYICNGLYMYGLFLERCGETNYIGLSDRREVGNEL